MNTEENGEMTFGSPSLLLTIPTILGNNIEYLHTGMHLQRRL